MTLRLVHPAPEGQGTRPPRGRRLSGVLSLTHEERRNLRAALHNLRLRLGGWDVLAAIMEVPIGTLHSASCRSLKAGSPGLALRAARAAGTTVEHILSGKIAPAGICPTCGAVGERPERRTS